MAPPKKKKVKLITRMITCKKCGWSFTNKNTSCPSCGTPVGFLDKKEMVEVLQFYMDMNGIWLERKKAIKTIKNFKKKFHKWPSEMDLAIIANEFVEVQAMDKQALKEREEQAKEIEKAKKKKEEAKKEVVKKKGEVVDIDAKIREIRERKEREMREAAEAKAKAEAEMAKEKEPTLIVPEAIQAVTQPAKPPAVEVAPVPCPQCHHENPAGSAFCFECGANLKAAATAPEVVAPAQTVTCPQCGHENPAGNKFCPECGCNLAELAAPTKAPKPTPTPALAPTATPVPESAPKPAPAPATPASLAAAAEEASSSTSDILAKIQSMKADARAVVGEEAGAPEVEVPEVKAPEPARPKPPVAKLPTPEPTPTHGTPAKAAPIKVPKVAPVPKPIEKPSVAPKLIPKAPKAPTLEGEPEAGAEEIVKLPSWAVKEGVVKPAFPPTPASESASISAIPEAPSLEEPDGSASPEPKPVPALVKTAPPGGTCPECGYENPADSMFCMECGAKLGTPAAPTVPEPPKVPEAPEPPAAPEAPAVPEPPKVPEAPEPPAAPEAPAVPETESTNAEIECLCGKVNPPESRFCLECGSKFKV